MSGIARTAIIAAFVLAILTGCQTANVDQVAVVRSAQEQGDDVIRGRTMFRQGNYGLAERHFRQALEARADDAEAWLGLAAAYDKTGRFDLADRAYSRLLELSGHQPRIVSNMGYSQLLRGNKSEARRLFLEAREGLQGDSTIEANLVMASL